MHGAAIPGETCQFLSLVLQLPLPEQQIAREAHSDAGVVAPAP